MPSSRKLILYIASSLDGYIAQNENDLSFLSLVEKEGEDYGYKSFMESVDTVIMGRKTYDWVTAQMAYPHSELRSYIITRTPRPAIGTIQFYSRNLSDLIARLKAEEGKNIFCDGGAEIANELSALNLIDEYIISVIPVLLGSGIRLFKDGRPMQTLTLISAKTYDTGLTQLHYSRTL